jgi:hypothetical protein
MSEKKKALAAIVVPRDDRRRASSSGWPQASTTTQSLQLRAHPSTQVDRGPAFKALVLTKSFVKTLIYYPNTAIM